jgi:hypothetical protein
MDELTKCEIDYLKLKKFPGASYAILVNLIGISFTLLLWMAYFIFHKKGIQIGLFEEYRIHIAFPIVLWTLFYGISAILNIRINKDIQKKVKVVQKAKLFNFKYNRRFPYSAYHAFYSKGNNSSHLGEYILLFENNEKYITNIKPDQPVVGQNYRISKARYSKIIVSVEKLE